MKTKLTVRIKGGKSLDGTIEIVSNKNAVLPALTASILSDKPIYYNNIHRTPDVQKILNALILMGAKVADNDSRIAIWTEHLNTWEVPSSVEGMQAAYLFVGPLLARFGQASVPITSGCNLGYRGPEDHIAYLSKLDVESSIKEGQIHFRLIESIKDERLVALDADIEKRKVTYLSRSVTPTENVLMLLAKTDRYETKLVGIAQEPHVVQLINLLRLIGVRITGEGSTLSVLGANHLGGTDVEFWPDPDHVHYFGAAVQAVMTKSNIMLKTKLTENILHMNEFMKSMGIKFEITNEGVLILGRESSFNPDESFPKEIDENGSTAYIMNPSPWPTFPVDCLPSFIAFSTMNSNMDSYTISNNWMFRDGITYAKAMKDMGANITYDRQRVITFPTESGNPYISSNGKIIEIPSVIEGCRAILSCGLAGGDHIYTNAQYISRRDPHYFANLENDLKADIQIFGPDEKFPPEFK